jgi:hypothetical protein
VRGAVFPDALGPALAAFALDGNRVDGRLVLRSAPDLSGRPAVRLAGSRVAGFASATGPGLEDSGVALMERYAVDGAEDDSSFERGILLALAARGGLRATAAHAWVDAARPPAPRPALLLDWNGVLRAKIGTSPEGWSRGAAAAVRRAASAGWHVFALTDRPVGALAAELLVDGGAIDDARVDAAGLLRAWGADASRSVAILSGASAASLPDGVARRGFLGGDLDALAAGVLARAASGA